tara:strand:+ start:2688 stop:3548 length:861 start_codon:yes stop_codon:yes gene_type:complete
MISCEECGCREFNFNERLGEKECSNCGLVLIYDAFEEQVILAKEGELVRNPDNNRLGSIITGKGSYKFNRGGLNNSMSTHINKALVMSNMILARLGFSSIKRDAEMMYMSLYEKNVFGASNLEVRCSAMVYILLEENGTPVKTKDIIEEFDCNIKLVNKMIRKIRKHRKPNMRDNSLFKFKRELSKLTDDLAFHLKATEVYEFFEGVIRDSHFNKGKSYDATICWITVNMFNWHPINRGMISDKLGLSTVAIWKQTQLVLELIGLTKAKEVKGKTFADLINIKEEE